MLLKKPTAMSFLWILKGLKYGALLITNALTAMTHFMEAIPSLEFK